LVTPPQMTSSQQVTLELATPDSAPIVGNLLQLYLHDLSEVFSIPLGADGRFQYDRLAQYWSEPRTHMPFLIRCAGSLAGFALVTHRSPASNDPQDLDVAEFFILRSSRRSGVGQHAAFLLWNRVPGKWVVRVSEENHAAGDFWERTVGEYTRGTFSVRQHPGRLHVFRAYTFQSSTTSVIA
jgi:predicted acetyltransferase